MDIRERIEAFWAGERPDRIPFTIYQNEWRHTASDPAWEPIYEKGLGVTWHLSVFREEFGAGIEMFNRSQGALDERVIRTPVGEVVESYVDGWRQKFFLETRQDYEVFTYLARHTEVVPNYAHFEKRANEIGKYGVPMSITGRTPNQTILVDLVGVENYAYHLADLGDAMQELYDALLDHYRAKVDVVAAGPGRFVSVLENFTAETLGPGRYRKLLLPVYQELFPKLQAAGKVVGTHYDGQLSACKNLIAGAPIDLIESLTPPPEGDMTLAECRAVWPDKLFWSNINVDCYYLPPEELKAVVRQRVAEAAPDGKRLAFEVSEQYPDNWPDSLPVVLEALDEIG